MSARQLMKRACAVLLVAVAAVPGWATASGRLDPELTVPLRAQGGPELVFPERGTAGLLLTVPARRDPDLTVRVALATSRSKPGGATPSMDFDLLGDAPAPVAPAEDPSLRTRRKMLNLHQGLGLGLLGLQLGSTVTGQLNYSDKFGTANTGRYKATHRVLVYSDIVAFAAVGGIALFAPTEKGAPPRPFGRTTIHKIGMALATVGMITQGYLGIRTAQREGYLDKQSYGRAHLAVGYATLAAMGVAVGAIVF